MRHKTGIIRFTLLSLLAASSFLVGCQTTRLPTAVRNADNSALLVQVSEDPTSLIWNGNQRGNKDSLNKMSRSSPSVTDPTVLQMRAELLLVGRMSRAAAENARLILRRDIRNVRALKTLVKSALIEKKAHEALALCSTAAEYSPQDAELVSLEGLAQHQLENLVFAKILWSRALTLDPSHIPTLMNLGVFLFQNGHVKKAGAHFDRVLAIQPEHLDALVGRALVLSAEGRGEDAVAGLEAVLKRTGENAFVLGNLALISRDRLKDYKRAAGFVERTLALQGTDRRSLEAALSMKQELRRLMLAQDKQISDENIRSMAESVPSSAGASEGDSVSVGSDPAQSEIQKLEESIK